MRINTLLNDDAPASSSPAGPKGPGRGNWARNRTSAVTSGRTFKSRLDATTSQDGASPSTSAPTFNGPHGFYLPLNGSDPSHKRTRPLTQHQLAVEQYRRRRVDVILDRGIRIEYAAAARRRRTSNTFMRSWIRCKGMADGYDTDEESHAQAMYQQDIEVGTKTPPPMPAGLVPLDFGEEVNDHGEESYYRAKMLSRAIRRLERWEGGKRRVRGGAGGAADRRPVTNTSIAVAVGNGLPPAEDDSEDDDPDDDDDDVMQDAEDLRRDDDSESSAEDEDMERERGFDPHVLPPLPMMH
jgi:Ino eighty subunit 1